MELATPRTTDNGRKGEERRREEGGVGASKLKLTN